jgi:hypothetical protein
MEKEIEKEESEKNEEKANEENKKSRLDIFASAKSHVLGFLSCAKNNLLWIKVKSLKFCKWAKDNPNESISLLLVFVTFLLALSTAWMALYTRELSNDNSVLIEANNEMLDLTSQANERQEKLFKGQNKPLIDVIPIGIVQTEMDDEKPTKICTTFFSVVNYSGFEAHKISYDIKYQSDWISEWVKANADNERKIKESERNKVEVDPNVSLNHPYVSRPIMNIPILMPGETKEGKLIWPPRNLEEVPPLASGEFDLKKYVVDNKDGFQVKVRVTWENKDGYVFDEIHKYKLICTKKGKGHSFTFIPEGIVSQKKYD